MEIADLLFPAFCADATRLRLCQNSLNAWRCSPKLRQRDEAGCHMKRFIEGQDRGQVTLLPECLDDFIAEDNPVRVVDAFVEELDLHGLGFDGVAPADTGRPSYHPCVLLKIYIYGYLNRVQSSRRLERECQRNVELMWLTGRLAPDFKTIADFRHGNGKGIRNVCKRFIVLCRELDLFSQAIVAIDSSKFKAVNNRDRNFTAVKIDRFKEQIEQSIQRYLEGLETADRTQSAGLQAKTERVQEKIKKLRQRMKQLDEIKTQLESGPDTQLSTTDPAIASRRTSADNRFIPIGRVLARDARSKSSARPRTTAAFGGGNMRP